MEQNQSGNTSWTEQKGTKEIARTRKWEMGRESEMKRKRKEKR